MPLPTQPITSISRNLPPLNALRAFEAAGRHSSFTRAAAELNVSHAAISRHVRGLEKRLQVQLFQNVARGVELTEKGKKYLPEVSMALDKIAEATDALTTQNSGLVTISCEPTFALKWLVPRMGEFYEQNPDVEIKIDPSFKLADVGNYECDLAIRFHRGELENVPADRICDENVFPVAAPSLVSKLQSLEEVFDYLLLEEIDQLWQRWAEVAGFSDHPRTRLSPPQSTLMVIEAALAGQGIALLSPGFINDALQDGRLVQLSNITLYDGSYFLAYNKETVRRKPVQAVRNWILESTTNAR
ncbi:MAG: LysR substrate-binding domain-containing protein [Hyphomicrobiales bacterium]